MTEIHTSMRGVQLVGHGGFDKLLIRDDIPTPEPGPFDVLIKVGAAGVNNTDLNTRLAWYSKSERDSSTASWSGNAIHFPRIQGADVCGKIVATGEKVSNDLMGQRVLIEPCIQEAGGKKLVFPWYFGSECDGGFADYTVVAARHAHKVNSKFSDIELASFPCSYSTAENLLTRANVTVNDVVVVTGASGGVGSAAVQLAKARGAEVIGVTSSSKADAVRRLGAQKTLDRSDKIIEKLGKNSIDVVIDLVAGAQWTELLDILKPFGRYAVAGAIAGALVELDVRTLYLKDLSFFGCTVLGEHVFSKMVSRIEAEEIIPVVSDVFSLGEIVKAQKQFEKKQHIGKLVIDMSLSI